MSLAANAETARNFTTALRPSPVSLEFAVQTAINQPTPKVCDRCESPAVVMDDKKQFCVSCYETCGECHMGDRMHWQDCTRHPDQIAHAMMHCIHGVRWDCSPPCGTCNAEPWTGDTL